MFCRNLGLKQASPLLDDIRRAAWKLYGSKKTNGVIYVDAYTNNFCAMGAAASATDSYVGVPQDTMRSRDVVQELFFAIPRVERDALVQNMIDRFSLAGCNSAPSIREAVVVAHNDSLTKGQCTEWAFRAVKRVNERYA